jgi:predicted amidohydrolase YtcJ
MREGVKCAGGSDAPVEDCDPLLGLYDAIHRLPHACKVTGGAAAAAADDVFLPDERLSFAEALWLYTQGAAFACGAEGRLGRVEQGYMADFVVLDRDVTRDPAQLLGAQVREVWVGGQRRVANGRKEGQGAAGGGLVDGPYVPGKNGLIGTARVSAPLLPGKRGARCCAR